MYIWEEAESDNSILPFAFLIRVNRKLNITYTECFEKATENRKLNITYTECFDPQNVKYDILLYM